MSKPSLRFRLLGFRMVEHTDDHFIVRFPFWCTARVIDLACEKMLADAAIVGKNFRAVRGNRLVRFERVAPRPHEDGPLSVDLLEARR